MTTHLIFQSDRFRPYLPDDCQVNPNVLGFELAEWLSRQLAGRGVITSYPVAEDWGWMLEFGDHPEEYRICCSGEAVDGKFEWRVYAQPVKRMFRTPATGKTPELSAAIRSVLETEGIAVSEESQEHG